MEKNNLFERNFNASKEDLRQMLENAKNEHERLEEETKYFSSQSKLNGVVLGISIIVAFSYPLYSEEIDKIVYTFFWLSAFYIFFLRIKLYGQIMINSLASSSLKMIESAIENDLEKIRKEEYDNFSREATTEKDS